MGVERGRGFTHEHQHRASRDCTPDVTRDLAHPRPHIRLARVARLPQVGARVEAEAAAVRLDVFQHDEALDAVVVTAGSADRQPHRVAAVIPVLQQR